jgi:hypothetical protein
VANLSLLTCRRWRATLQGCCTTPLQCRELGRQPGKRCVRGVFFAYQPWAFSCRLRRPHQQQAQHSAWHLAYELSRSGQPSHVVHMLQVQRYKLARAGHVAQLNAAGRAAARAAGVPYVDVALMSAAFHSPAEYLKVMMRRLCCCSCTFVEISLHALLSERL